MHVVHPPLLFRKLYPQAIWNIQTQNQDNILYLTFDDGPTRDVTPQVLDILREFDAKATFFCIGKNVLQYPEIYKRLTKDGHAIGNHTFHHKNGWKTNTTEYLDDVQACLEIVNTDLFRPPYGKMKPKQYRKISERYKIVMWDVLSYDFDPNTTVDQCFQRVLKNAVNGSVVVFHDSLKAGNTLLKVLPRILEHYSSLGFRFNAING